MHNSLGEHTTIDESKPIHAKLSYKASSAIPKILLLSDNACFALFLPLQA